MPDPIVIQAKSKKPLDVEYDGTVYRLPGRIPGEVLSAQASVRRPTLTTKAVKDEYENQVGAAILSVFFENVLPAEFQAAIDLTDIGPVFMAWSNHVELGKGQSSTDS